MDFNKRELAGSIVLVRNQKRNFLQKQIIFHMKIYARMTNRKALPFHHAETLVWSDNARMMYTAGARAHGVEYNLANHYYTDKDFLILVPGDSLTDGENHEIWNFIHFHRDSKYQTMNFLSWITYLKTGFWFSKKGNQRMYCYEMAADIADKNNRWPHDKSTEMVSVYDLYENAFYYPLNINTYGT